MALRTYHATLKNVFSKFLQDAKIAVQILYGITFLIITRYINRSISLYMYKTFKTDNIRNVIAFTHRGTLITIYIIRFLRETGTYFHKNVADLLKLSHVHCPF